MVSGISLASVVAACAASAAAANMPPYSANSTNLSWSASSAGETTCTKPTYFRGKQQPANWRDCIAMWSTWSDKGAYHVANVSTSGVVSVLRYNDCAFGVSTSSEGNFIIGNEDLHTVIGKALNDYSSGTDLAARGDMDCERDTDGKAKLHWQIFHPSD